ncbi:hypothetical protein LR48_Vigan377s000200 [Vigna angularis]|uniref:Uncharacterized protein n=1 Tax=Phaseolus angularis TaxID=3914 RepID=A0A0L9T911_PHAAN|nr:hypothetical protein LR48_Vigan377s000200 [Vigna angularis]
MQSLHRGQVATTEMIIGMYDTPQDIGGLWMNLTMWWHGQRSKLRVVELEQLKLQLWITMDDDEEEDDDAFEDAEEEEEEEDSDDNMG